MHIATQTQLLSLNQEWYLLHIHTCKNYLIFTDDPNRSKGILFKFKIKLRKQQVDAPPSEQHITLVSILPVSPVHWPRPPLSQLRLESCCFTLMQTYRMHYLLHTVFHWACHSNELTCSYKQVAPSIWRTSRPWMPLASEWKAQSPQLTLVLSKTQSICTHRLSTSTATSCSLARGSHRGSSSWTYTTRTDTNTKLCLRPHPLRPCPTTDDAHSQFSPPNTGIHRS